MASKTVEENRNIPNYTLGEYLAFIEQMVSSLPAEECPTIISIGPPGMGKTEGTMSVLQRVRPMGFKQKGLPTAVRHLSQVHPLDMGGVGLDNHSRQMYFAQPPLYTELMELANGEGAVGAFLDEYDRCPPITQSSTLQFLLSREINGFKRPHTYCFAAANAWHAQYTFELDKAAASRLAICHVQPNHEEWLRWAAEHSIVAPILVTISQMPSLLNQHGGFDSDGKASDNSGAMKVADPRSWVQASRALAAGVSIDYLASFVGINAAEKVKIYSKIQADYAKEIKQLLNGKPVSFPSSQTWESKSQEARVLFAIYLSAAGQIKEIPIFREFLENGMEQIGKEKTYIASRLTTYNIPAVTACEDKRIREIHLDIFKATVGDTKPSK